MNINKLILKFAAAVFFLIASVTAAVSMDYDSFYETGIGMIQDNEYEKGREELSVVAESADAPVEMRFKASMWRAHSYLLQEKQGEAREAVKKIFEMEDYENYERRILSRLNHLQPAIRMYRNEKYNYAGGIGSGERTVDESLKVAMDFYDDGKILQAKDAVEQVISSEPENEEAKKLLEEIQDIEQMVERELSQIHVLLNINDIKSARVRINQLLNTIVDDERVVKLERELVEKEEKIMEINEKLEEALRLYNQRDYSRARRVIDMILEYEEKAGPGFRAGKEDEDARKDIDIEELYSAALENIDVYEIDAAQEKLRKILESEYTSDEKRYKTSFLKAFVHNYNNEIQEAEMLFISLMRSGLSEKYDINILPESIAQDSELLRIYNDARQEHLKWGEIAYKNLEDALEKAYELREYIREISRAKVDARRTFVDFISKQIESAYEQGDYIEAARRSKIMLQVNPTNQTARYIHDASLSRLYAIFGYVAQRERDILMAAVEAYLGGNYRLAESRFKRIREVDPGKMNVLIAQSQIQEKVRHNRERAAILVREAEEALDNKYFDKAIEKILSAQTLDELNIEAVTLFEEAKALYSQSMR